MNLTYDDIKSMYANAGYRFYDNGPFNVNLFGIRSGYETVDHFDDYLGIAYRDDFGNGIVVLNAATTKPGLYYLKNKMGNVNGTAILLPGYYPHCWEMGEHKHYPALVQRGMPFKVWRDNDNDGVFDIGGKIYTDVTGLNRHTTSFVSVKENVGPYSAGCQVDRDFEDHQSDMAVCRKSKRLYGNCFSYALFEKSSI